MTPRPKIPFRRALEVAAIAAVAVAVAALVPRLFPHVGAVENHVRDIRVAGLTAPAPQHPDILILAITEETLQAFPYRAPLDRAFLARLLGALDAAGVKAIGMDILFDQPTEAAKDAQLFETMRALKAPLVVTWANTEDLLTPKQAAYIDSALAGLRKGLPNLSADPIDGVVRTSYPGRAVAGSFVPGFAAALAAAAGREVPKQPATLAYRPSPDGKAPPFRTFPAHTAAFLPKPWLAGKIVLIGADMPHTDRFPAPFGGGGTVAGVEVHAHALAQIVDGRKAPGMGWPAELLVLAAVALIGLGIAGADIAVPLKVAGVMLGLVLLWVGAFALYRYGGPLTPLVSPSLAFVGALGVGSVYLQRHERQQKRFIRDAFSHFTPPQVVDQLVADPSKLSLGGERREITCLFTDLAGFTSMVESGEPGVVLPKLNTYLDGMCRIAFEYAGTIDKIVGDSLHVMFGAPLDQPDHARRAVRCALAMDRFSRDFVADQKRQGFAFGGTRIGVQTGEAVVGNFGGDVFFDYTAHGDVINTAARLESVNKHLGTTTCVGGPTVAQCPDVHFRPIGTLMLKGKEKGLETFEPVAPGAWESPRIREYLQAFQQLRAGAGDGGAGPGEAARAFAELLARYPDDKLAALHAGRLRAGETGVVIVLKEK